jgi:hypothetical protein
MPATFRTFFNGMAKGAQYIPDILQDIAIQRQRQQQIDLGVRAQKFTEDVYKEGAPQREANLKATEAGTQASLATTEAQKVAKALADEELVIAKATEKFQIETAENNAETSKYLTKEAKVKAENAQKVLDQTFKESNARLNNLSLEGANLGLQHIKDSLQVKMSLVGIGSHLQNLTPEQAKQLDALQITDIGQALATISKLNLPKEFINYTTGLGDKLWEIEQSKTEYRANKLKEGYVLFKGDRKKAEEYAETQSKPYEDMLAKFEKDMWGYESVPLADALRVGGGTAPPPTVTSQPAGSKWGEVTPNWQNNPQLQGGGAVDVGSIYDKWNKPNVGMNP